MNKTPKLEEIKKDFEKLKEEIRVSDVYSTKSIYWEKLGINKGLDRAWNFFALLLATKEHDEELLREFRWFVNENDVSSADATGVIDFWIKEFIASRKISSSGEGK
jgi:hypothetical protein